jgi:hypothetical protein
VSRAAPLVLLALALVGCGTNPLCPTAEGTVREGGEVTCVDVAPVVETAALLAARPLTEGQRRALLAAIGEREAADAAEARALLGRVAAWRAGLAAMAPRDAAVERSRELFRLERGEGLLPGAGWEGARSAVLSAAAVWEVAADDGVVLTEMDVEGMIRLASLCREVQGGSPLLVSVADRVGLYQAVRQRFTGAPPEVRRAMIAVGPFWASARDAWRSAPPEVQQAWIAEAPLPPSMTTDSPGYVRAVMDVPLDRLVGSLHERIGPLAMAADGR